VVVVGVNVPPGHAPDVREDGRHGEQVGELIVAGQEAEQVQGAVLLHPAGGALLGVHPVGRRLQALAVRLGQRIPDHHETVLQELGTLFGGEGFVPIQCGEMTVRLHSWARFGIGARQEFYRVDAGRDLSRCAESQTFAIPPE
jgi:hypothetical protein